MSKNTLIGVLVLAVAGLGGWLYLQDKDSAQDAASGKRFISIGTGGPTGVYFATGNAICRLVAKEAAEGRKKGRKHGIRDQPHLIGPVRMLVHGWPFLQRDYGFRCWLFIA